MATEFKYLKFGLVPIDFDAGTLESSERIINSFLSSWNSYVLLENAQAQAEIFAITRRYIGKNFRNWLIVNYREGVGARKELVRKIVGYIAGRLSARTITSQIKIDMNHIQNTSKGGEVIKTSILFDDVEQANNRWLVDEIDFSIVEDRHLYDFLAVIGPELAAKFCLSMDGIYYDK